MCRVQFADDLLVMTDVDFNKDIDNIPLVSLATNDNAPSDVVIYLLTAEQRRKQHVLDNVKERLDEKTTGFHDVMKKTQIKDICGFI